MNLKDFGITNDRLEPGATAFLGQHVYCVGDEQGHIKIIVDPQGRDIPPNLRAEGYHAPITKELADFAAMPDDQKASYNSDGTVARAGYLPGGRYVGLDGVITGGNTIQEAINDFLNAGIKLSKAVNQK